MAPARVKQMELYYCFLTVMVMLLLLLTGVEARFYDECVDFRYVHAHSIDAVVDFRNAQPPDYDTARFKRDMQGRCKPRLDSQ